ncbi:ATP synthase subunit b, mitochondrial [Galendromus occidentalis]|uniref:ATP synthase subunit b n=1 Tax=Galendromus occidentalis TaxID=34638 RepID=A0AAJ6VYM4_9ACAR|nr:ATP synthase subunit b, mitochondrial [Galendromus occidentalis]
MLSRVALARKLAPATLANARCSSTQPVLWKREVLEVKEHPDRDLVNFPRLKQPELPGPVRMGFIPEEWFQFFYPKTGLLGPYVFGAGLITTVLSKEIMVVEEEFLFGICFFTMIAAVHKMYGKDVAAILDKEVDKELEENRRFVHENEKSIEEAIQGELLAQKQTAAQDMIIESKKENIALQLEAEYRRRNLKVFQEVKKKLDYHLEVVNIERRLQQQHMVDWIVSNVLKSLSPQQEKEAFNQCIVDLKSLASRA